MRFKEFYNQSTELKEQKLRPQETKLLGKTLTAKVNILNIDGSDITSDQFGEFLSEKDTLKQFIWMKKGFKTKLVDGGDGFLASEEGDEYPTDVLERILNARYITIK